MAKDPFENILASVQRRHDEWRRANPDRNQYIKDRAVEVGQILGIEYWIVPGQGIADIAKADGITEERLRELAPILAETMGGYNGYAVFPQNWVRQRSNGGILDYDLEAKDKIKYAKVIERCRNYHYHDFNSPAAMPKMEMHVDLLEVGLATVHQFPTRFKLDVARFKGNGAMPRLGFSPEQIELIRKHYATYGIRVTKPRKETRVWAPSQSR